VREPYETLLAPLRNVWWLEPLLAGERPDWDKILTDPYWNSLSTGEAVLLNIARAMECGDRVATVSDLLHRLDGEHRARALYALALHCELTDV
jgi:hypothetical protein